MKQPTDVLIKTILEYYVDKELEMGDTWWFSREFIVGTILKGSSIPVLPGQVSLVMKTLRDHGLMDNLKKLNECKRFYVPRHIVTSPWLTLEEANLVRNVRVVPSRTLQIIRQQVAERGIGRKRPRDQDSDNDIPTSNLVI
jgi:hypothetical protein